MSGEDDTFEELSEMATETEQDPFEELAEEAGFTEAGGELNEEELWERLTEPSEGVRPEDIGETVVEKSKYCQRCEHFSAPPDVHCGHEGTEILELVDSGHYRVVNCPVVARRQEVDEFE